MKPGRELDALVAEKVMGLDIRPVAHRYGHPPFSASAGAVNYAGEWTEQPEIPHYSTDIAAAWLLLDVIEGKISIMRHRYQTGSKPVRYGIYFNSGQNYIEADTISEVICLAAFKALGVEIPE